MTEPLMRRDEMHFNINVLTTYLGYLFFSEVYTLNYFSIFTSYFPVLSITVYCFRVIDYLQTHELKQPHWPSLLPSVGWLK